jgi:hypothetical protein
MKHLLVVALSLTVIALSAAGHAFVLVDEGGAEGKEASAVIVVADEATRAQATGPGRSAGYAARELARHVEKATGITLPVAVEADIPIAYPYRIYLGNTAAARAQGIVVEDLPKESCILRTIGTNLFVVGKDEELRYVGHDVGGTLFGVYELLDRYLGVRWLWPGELGIYVPKADRVALPGNLNETVAPAFTTTLFRRGLVDKALQSYDPAVARIAFSKTGLRAYSDGLRDYLIRHRAWQRSKQSEWPPRPSYWFSHLNLWPKYGKTHPEFFAMHPDGRRGPSREGRDDAALCVSNPNLHKVIIEEVWAGKDWLDLGEVDDRAFCHCPKCLEWDGPQPAESAGPQLGLRPSTSNRYARFWKTLYEMAAERNPKVTGGTFLYFNYLAAPTTDIKLPPRIFGEFVPWGNSRIVFYPMDEQAHEWVKNQWLGWSKTGISMVYRPNYLLGGYVMPHLSTWQVGDMLHFAHQHGMLGFDHDSLWGQWAAKGPMLYLHMRLTTHPQMDIATIRQEFFSAFGPAAKHIEEYFDYWEHYSSTKATGGGLGWDNPTRAHMLYPPEVFTPAEAMLQTALEAAKASPLPEFSERVQFVQAGLQHAKLAARFTSTLDFPGKVPVHDKERFEAAKAALNELIAFRRAHEHLFISDYLAAAFCENRQINLDLLFRDFEEIREAALGELLPNPWGEWRFRKDPKDVGVTQQWFTKLPENGDWTAVRVPAFLAETPVGGYLGYGWYSTEFTLPAKWTGRRIILRFGAVDEQAWVYLNGQSVGEHTVKSQGVGVGELWDKPFTIKVEPKAARFGEKNHLVVRTHASAGMSGIWGDVKVYLAPAE